MQFCICSHKMKMGVKLKADYSAVLHMPVLKEGTERVSQLAGSMLGHQSYTQPGECKTNFITKETHPCRFAFFASGFEKCFVIYLGQFKEKRPCC